MSLGAVYKSQAPADAPGTWDPCVVSSVSSAVFPPGVRGAALVVGGMSTPRQGCSWPTTDKCSPDDVAAAEAAVEYCNSRGPPFVRTNPQTGRTEPQPAVEYPVLRNSVLVRPHTHA